MSSCIICLRHDTYGYWVALPCGHRYHLRCNEIWLGSSDTERCPLGCKHSARFSHANNNENQTSTKYGRADSVLYNYNCSIQPVAIGEANSVARPRE